MPRPSPLPILALSSALLFYLELHVGQLLAPALGGGAAVWLTTVLGFQLILLLGYAASVFVPWSLRPTWILFGLLVAGASTLRTGAFFAPGLGLGVLLVALGLAGMLPLMLRQGDTTPARIRGHWIAASNAGAFVGLFVYSVAEPFLGLKTASIALRVGVGILAVLLVLGRRASPERDHVRYRVDAASLASAAVGVFWYMSHHARLEVTLPPSVQLWAGTLSLYLISFALPFLKGTSRSRVVWVAIALGVGMTIVAENAAANLRSFAGPLALFLGALAAHTALRHGFHEERPWTHGALDAAIGGAAGGLVAMVVMPRTLSTDEQLVVAAVALIALEIGRTRSAMVGRFAALCLVVVFGILAMFEPLQSERTIRVVRSWYGESHVLEYEKESELHHHVALEHQHTVHGAQYLNPDLLDLPTAYFSIYSGAGIVMNTLLATPAPRASLRTAVVGLGTGALASYAQAGDFVRFIEIDREVADLCQGDEPAFSFLELAEGEIDVVIGDGRRVLFDEDARGEAPYDALFLDAFTGGHVPTHLLTLEAFELYRRRVRHDGWIAVHTSNAVLDLRPVVYAAAEHIGGTAVFVRNRPRTYNEGDNRRAHLVMQADWVVIGFPESPWSELRMRLAARQAADEIVVQWAESVTFDGLGAWTDDKRSVWALWQPWVGSREALVER